MRRLAATLVALAATLAIAGCGQQDGTELPASAPAASAPTPMNEPTAATAVCEVGSGDPTAVVAMVDFAFEPTEVQGRVGEPIGWRNDGGVAHTATPDDGACTTPALAIGQTGSLVFSEAGTYPYHCDIHPTMTGTITITE